MTYRKIAFLVTVRLKSAYLHRRISDFVRSVWCVLGTVIWLPSYIALPEQWGSLVA